MKRIHKAVLPVGGFGTRFLPATKSVPKEMLPILDRPLVQFAMDELTDAGITDCLFITGRQKHSIEDYFDDAYELERALERKKDTETLRSIRSISSAARIYFTRQHQPLGLGHAVWCARSWIGDDEYFAVILPDDVFIPARCLRSMIDVFEQTKSHCLIAVEDVSLDRLKNYGVVGFEKNDGLAAPHNNETFITPQVRCIVEKPQNNPPSSLGVVGRYILHRSIFDILEELVERYQAIDHQERRGEIQLTEGLNAWIQRGGVAHGVIAPYERFDCGERQGMLRAILRYAQDDDALWAVVRDYAKKH